MSVRKSCYTCKHNKQGICYFGNGAGGKYCKDDMEYWELSDGFKADMIHDAETVPVVTEKEETEHDAVQHPAHYTSGGIECIDCIKAALGQNFIGFLMGNVIKYSYRYRHKNGIEDLKKARWYLDRAIKEIGDERTE